jgi:hypothetical protein
MATKKEIFLPKNKVEGSERDVTSPSGKYKLRVTRFKPPNDGWHCAQGEVFEQDKDEPIEVVNRNYSSFPFEWIEGHADGHSYLVCGEDYQGQTVIQLDTGIRRDFLPEEASEGFGFCWASYEYDPKTQFLFVEGCYWACPYEWRIYDFSNPLEFKHIPIMEDGEERCMDNSAKKPTVDGNLVTFYEVKDFNDYEDDYGVPPADDVVWEGEGDDRRTVVATITLELKDGQLHPHSTWVSDLEKAYRERQDEAHRKFEEQVANYKATDPLYLAFIEGIKDPAFSPEDGIWRGFTHDKWCSEWKGKEPRWGRNVVSKPQQIKVEWAEISGPILVQVGNDPAKVFMEHSVESMQAALAYAKEKALEMAA